MTKRKKLKTGDLVFLREDIGRFSDGAMLYDNPELSEINIGGVYYPYDHVVVKHGEPLVVIETGPKNEYNEKSVKILHKLNIGWLPFSYVYKP